MVKDGYMHVMYDLIISDSLGEQLPEVGSEWTQAEVPREAHKELVWPVPTVSVTAQPKLLSCPIESTDYHLTFIYQVLLYKLNVLVGPNQLTFSCGQTYNTCCLKEKELLSLLGIQQYTTVTVLKNLH